MEHLLNSPKFSLPNARMVRFRQSFTPPIFCAIRYCIALNLVVSNFGEFNSTGSLEEQGPLLHNLYSGPVWSFCVSPCLQNMIKIRQDKSSANYTAEKNNV